MELALYRKYRPQIFKDLVGQQPIRITLEQQIKTGRVAHAYLFTGPRGVGKTTTARLLAKTLNCDTRKEGEGEPCATCDSCTSIIKGSSLNIIEIDAASHTGVDNVRDNIIESVNVVTQKDKWKVFIIDEVHMLSTAAFNALLKTLEEPPKNVAFILATTEIHKVPQTIISRCQRFDFRLVPEEALHKRLNWLTDQENVAVTDGVIDRIVEHAHGSVRDAESLLQKLMALGEERLTGELVDLLLPRSDMGSVVAWFELLAENNIQRSLEHLETIHNEGVDADAFLQDALRLSQHLLVRTYSKGQVTVLSLDPDMMPRVQKLGDSFTTERLLRLIDILYEVQSLVKSSSIPQFPAEIATVKFCERFRPTPSVEEDQPAGGDGKTLGVSSESVDVKENKLPTKSASQVQPVTVTPKIENQPAGGESKEVVQKSQEKKKESSSTSLENTILQEKWSELMKQTKKYNHALSFILEGSAPKECKDGCLVFSVSYKMHADKMQDIKMREALERSVEDVYGVKVRLQAEVGTALQGVRNGATPQVVKKDTDTKEVDASGDTSGTSLQDIVKNFGGQIVK